MSASTPRRSGSLAARLPRAEDVPDELLDETLFDRMKRRLGGLPRKSGRLSSIAMDISNLSMNPQFESTRMSFNLGQDDKTSKHSPDGKASANRSKRRSRKTKMSLLDELREDDEDNVVKKKPRLSHAAETQGNQLSNKDVGNTSVRSNTAEARKNETVVEGHPDPELRVKLKHRQDKTSDISLSRGPERERAKQGESFRVTRARSVHVPEQGEDDSILRRCLTRPSDFKFKEGEGRYDNFYPEGPSPSKVYRMKTNLSAASPSKQNYSRDSSRVREVDEEEPGNRTRRKRDESLNGSSSLEEPSPSKVYRMKTNQSATSTSRQNYLRDSSRVREVDEEEPGNRTRTRRKRDESLNGSSSLEEPSPSKVYRMKTIQSAASPSRQNYSRDSSRVREVDEEEPGNRTRTRRKRDESLNGSSSLEEPSPSKVYRKTNQSATSTSRQNYLRDSSRVRDVDEEEPGNRTRTRRKRDESLNGSSSLEEPSPSKVYRMKTIQSAASPSRQNYSRDSSRVREVDEEEPGNRTRTRRKRDESLNGSSSLKEPSPSKVYRMKTNQSATSTSRQNYLRDSSRVREVDEEEPGNRTRTRRKRDESLNGSSSLEEPSPSKVYRIKTNLSNAASTSRKHNSRDSSRMRRADEEEPRTRTRRNGDESLNRTRGSVFVPETCPDSGEEEMPGVDDVTVPETQPVPGDVSGDNVESDSEPVRPRQSNRSRKIVESESDYARSNRSGRVTAENTDTASSTRESRKSTSSQRRSSGRRRDGKDATEMEVDEVSYMDSKPRNVQENIANQLGGVVNNGSRRTDKMSSPPIKEIAELIETPSKVRKERELTPNKRRVSPRKRYAAPQDSPRNQHAGAGGDSDHVSMSKASGQAVERCFERQDLNSPAKNVSIERAEIYETGDQENDEIAVNLPEPLESGNERASQGRRPTGSHGKARRMMREDTVLDDDDGNTTQIKPRRHSRKKLSVVPEEIEEHSGFNSNATANDGVVDYADDDAVSDADDDRDADDDHDADDGDVDAGADEDGDDDENVDNGSANDDDIDDDGREDVDGDVGDDQQNLEEQAAKYSPPLIDEGNEQPDSDKSSSISQGLRRGDGVGLQNVGLENVREDSCQHTVSQGVAEEEDDDHDEQVFVNDDNESVNDAVNQVVEEKENRFEEGSRVFIEKRLGAGTLEKGRKGRLDSFEISGIEPVARDEDEPNAMDKSSGGDKKNQEDGNASRANTTKGGKAKRKRRNVPATTVHVDVRQHMKDRDFIHQLLDILAMPINPTDPLVMNVYNKLTAQNVIDEHPIPKDIVQKVFDKVNKKVYEEVHGAFNPREIQAMLSALDEVRGSTSGAGIDVDRSEKQLVALNVERVLETLPMTWPSMNRGNAAVERYNKLRRHVSKLLASIEEEKKDHVQYKVSVDMVREIRSLQASLDMNALVEEVKRSQHLASQFTKLKKFEKRAKKQESFAD